MTKWKVEKKNGNFLVEDEMLLNYKAEFCKILGTSVAVYGAPQLVI